MGLIDLIALGYIDALAREAEEKDARKQRTRARRLAAISRVRRMSPRESVLRDLLYTKEAPTRDGRSGDERARGALLALKAGEIPTEQIEILITRWRGYADKSTVRGEVPR